VESPKDQRDDVASQFTVSDLEALDHGRFAEAIERYKLETEPSTTFEGMLWRAEAHSTSVASTKPRRFWTLASRSYRAASSA
jgi:hypothetical protein